MLTRPSDISAQCVRRKICRILSSRHLPAFQCVRNYFNSLLQSGREERNKARKGLSTLPMLPWFLPEMPSINRLVIDRLKLIWKIRSLAKDAPSEALTAACLTDIRGTFMQQEAGVKGCASRFGIWGRTHLSCGVVFLRLFNE